MCCCRRLLFNQPDFIAQKSQLEELVIQQGNICDFYPMFHPELNVIEQYWGLLKHLYRLTPSTHSTNSMEKNVLNSLDAPSVEQIQRWAKISLILITWKQCSSENSTDLRTAQLVLLMPILQAWVVQRQHGRIADITAIGLCPQKWPHSHAQK